MDDKFSLLIKAVLDNSGIKTDVKQLQDILNKYSVDVAPKLDTASLMNNFKQVAKEMANEINKNFGTNLTGKDIYKAYTDQIKQSENAIKQTQKAQENLVNAMAKGREASEKAYEAEKKRQDLAQNNAINKELDKEYEDQQKLVNQMADLREKSQQVYQAEQKRQELAQSKAANKELDKEYEQLQKINKALNENKVSSDMTGVTSKYSTLASTPESLISDYKYLQSLSDKLNTSLDDPTKVATWREYETVLERVKNEIKDATTEAGRLATESEKITSKASMQNYLTKNSGISTDAKSQITSYMDELSSGAKISKSRLDEMTASLKSLDAEQRVSGKVGNSLTDSFKEQAKTFTQWITVSGAVMMFVSGLKDAVSELKDVDTILTEISKTNDALSSQDLVNLGQEAFSTASKYGQKATDYLTSVQEMNRSGFYDTLGNQMAELSTLAQSAGDMTADVSQQYILATNAAYKYQGSVEKLNAALDGQNQITNRNSVDMTTMATATSKAASVAETTGVKINELSAVIGTVEASTKEAGEEVGTGIKSLFINLQNVNSAKIVKTLDDAGVAMTKMVNGSKEMRTPIEILQDLQKVYNSLDSKDPLKSEITTNIGQKYHANELAALLSNWSTYEKMLTDYSEGTGSAMEEAGKSANNWQGSLNKLNNTFVAIIGNLVKAKDVILLLNGANKVLSVIEGLSSSLGLLGTALPIAGFVAFVKFFNAQNITNVARLAKEVKNLSAVEAVSELRAKGVAEAEIAATLSKSGYTASTIEATMATSAMAASEEVATASTVGLGTALKALIVANPVIAILAGITAAAAIGYAAWDSYHTSFDEAMDSMAESKEDFDGATGEMTNLTSKIETCKSRLKELQDLADKGTISVADQKELDKLTKTNEQLERQFKIQQAKQRMAAQGEIESAKTAITEGVESHYQNTTYGSKSEGFYNVIADTISPQKELEYATKEYDKITQSISDLNDKFDDGKISVDDYEYSLKDLTSQQTDARQRASDMSDTVNDLIIAYEDQLTAGGNLSQSDKQLYGNLVNVENGYISWTDKINESTDAISDSNNSIQTFIASTYKAVDATTALSDASEGLSKLKTAYEDFNDEGFVLASTLESLPDEIKNLKGFDLFSQIVGDPTNGTEKIQQAFNDITKQYLVSNNTLGGLVNASQSTIQSYIANLKAMGVQNAEEVVNSAYNAVNSENELITNATNEYESAYQKYLEFKDKSGLEYLNNEASNNSKLADALGSTYSSDYDNWTNLLKDKSQAYNQFVSAIAGSQIKLANGFGALSNDSLTKEKAQAIVNEANRKTVLTSDEQTKRKLQSNATTDLLTSGNVSQYTTEQVQSAQQYLNYVNQLSTMSDALKLDLSTVSTNFGTTFSPSSGGSSDSGSSVADAVKQTAQQFDFIQIAIQRMSDSLSSLKTSAENTFKSFTDRINSSGQAINAVTGQIQFQQQAYDAYMQKANAVGLSDVYKNQINSGNLNVEDVYDDTLKQQIQDYQTYYEEALKCQTAIEDLKQTQTELTQARIETLISKYKDFAQTAESANTKIQNKIDLKTAWGGTASTKDYSNMNKNILTQIKNINKQDTQLKELQKTVTKGSEAWYEYQKQIADNKSSISDLTKTMEENAKAAAALAGAKAKTKVEKLDSKDSLLEAKKSNATSATEANSYIDSEIANIASRQADYNQAVKTDKTNVKSASSALNKVKTTKENKKFIKQIKAAVKAKKEISKTLLADTLKLNDNGSLYNKCIKYNEYLEALDADKAIAESYNQEAQSTIADKAKEQFDNIQNQYENQLSSFSQNQTVLNNQISLAEAQGHKVSEAYYSSLIANEQANQSKLIEERASLQAKLSESLANGSIQTNTEEYYNEVNAINSVTNSIDESTTAIVNFNNNLRQVSWDNFDDGIDKMNNLVNESDYYISLMEKQGDLIDESGNFTDSGNATLALRNANYKEYMEEYQSYADEIARIKSEEDLSDENVIARLQELTEAQQQAVLSAEDENQAMIDLATQGYEAQKTKLKELIDTYKDLISTRDDMYDYQNSIADKTKTATDLQKQLIAISGDTSEENKANIQKLTVDFAAAQKDLKDTETERQTSEINDMLDDLYDDYADFTDSELKNTNNLIQQLIDGVSGSNSSSIIGLLSSLPGSLSSDLASLLNGGGITGSVSVIKAKGYASGTKRVSSSMMVETNEDGQEIIYDASNGGLLTALGQGDAVFSNPQVNNLWALSQLSPASLMSGLTNNSLPVVSSSNGGSPVTIDCSGMTVTGVNDGVDLANQFIHMMATDPRVIKVAQEVTVGRLSGNSNSLSARRYM